MATGCQNAQVPSTFGTSQSVNAGKGVEPAGARTGRESERYSVALSAFAASISSGVIRPATDSRMSWAFGLFFSTAR